MEAMYYPLVPRESPLDLSVKTVQKTAGPPGNYVGMILEQNRISSSQGNSHIVQTLPSQNFPSNSISYESRSNNPYMANSPAGSHPVMTSLLQQTSHASNYKNSRMPNLPQTISAYAGQNNNYTALPIHSAHSQSMYAGTCFTGNIVPVQKNRVHSEIRGQTSNGWNFQISQHSKPFYQPPVITHQEYHAIIQETKHTIAREYGGTKLDTSNKFLSPSNTHYRPANNTISAVNTLTNSNLLSQRPSWNTSGLSTLTFPSAVAPSPLPHIKKKEGADSCQKDSPRTARDFPDQPHQVTPFSKASGGLLDSEDIVMIDDCAQVGSVESFKVNQLCHHITNIESSEGHQSVVQPSQLDSDLSPNSSMPCLKAVSPNENGRNTSNILCPLEPPSLIKAVSSPQNTTSTQETPATVTQPITTQKFWHSYQDKADFGYLENHRLPIKKTDDDYCKDIPIPSHCREQSGGKARRKLFPHEKHVEPTSMTCLSQKSDNIMKTLPSQQLLEVSDKKVPSMHIPLQHTGLQCLTSSVISLLQPSTISNKSRIVQSLQSHTLLSSAMINVPEERNRNPDISNSSPNSQGINKEPDKLGTYCDNSEKSKAATIEQITESKNIVALDNGVKERKLNLICTTANVVGIVENKFKENSADNYPKMVPTNDKAVFCTSSEYLTMPTVMTQNTSLPSYFLVPSKNNGSFDQPSAPAVADIDLQSKPTDEIKLNNTEMLSGVPGTTNGKSHHNKLNLQENFHESPTITTNSITGESFPSSCPRDFKSEGTKSFRKRSMLQCLADSKGYVAEKKKRSKTNDLFADPSQLSREDRALQRAMLRFKQLEKKHVQSSDTPSTRLRSSRASKRKARDKAEDSSESLSDSERRSRTSFIDFQPEVLSSRTRHQKAICHQPKKYNRNAAYEEELKKEAKRLANLRARRKLRRRLLLRINKRSSCQVNCHDFAKIKIKKEPISEDSSKIESTEFVRDDASTVTDKEILKCKHLKSNVILKCEKTSAETVSHEQNGNRKISDMTVHPMYSLIKNSKLIKGRANYQATRRRIKSGLDMIARKKKANKKKKILPFILKVNHERRQMGISDLKKLIVNKSLGETPLHRAARQGNLNLVLLCLSTKFCNVNATDNANYTPLHEACAKGHLSVARALLENGANNDACATGGVRPIHDAIENDHVEIARLLLSYGSDPTIATYSGKTPSSLARSETMKEFLNGFLSDVSLETPCAWISKWQFAGSAKCLDPKKTGYDVCDNTMLDCGTKEQEDDDQGFLFELSEAPFLPTFLFSWANEKKAHNYLRLYDVLKQTGFSKEEFRERFPNLTIVVVPRHDFESRAVCCQLFITPESVEPASYHISLVLYDDVARSILGIDTLHVR